MEYKELRIQLPKNWYLELKDIADKHLIKLEDFAGQILLTFCLNYRLKNSPLITDAHKAVEGNCPSTLTNVSDAEPK